MKAKKELPQSYTRYQWIPITQLSIFCPCEN